jgi:GDP-L-fucose synthase
MNTLITGGSGLVGSCFDWGVKPNSTQMNLLDYGSISSCISSYGITEIIHLAAKVGGVKANNDNQYDFFIQNLLMNTNIISAVDRHGLNKATFVLSTCVFPHAVQYPVDVSALHMGEPHPTNYGYAYAKRMLEVGARTLREKGIKVRCVIPCNIYGKNDNYHLVNGHVIPSLVHKCYLAIQNDTPFEIWGSGKAEREFVYAPDIAKAITLIHQDERDIPSSVVVNSGNSHTIQEISAMIAKHMGFNGKMVFDISKSEGILRKPTISQFHSLYPNFQFTDIETGIYETCKFVKENYDRIRK